MGYQRRIKEYMKKRDFQQISRFISEMIHDGHRDYGMRIGNITQHSEWYQRPITHISISEYVRNGTRYRYNYRV